MLIGGLLYSLSETSILAMMNLKGSSMLSGIIELLPLLNMSSQSLYYFPYFLHPFMHLWTLKLFLISLILCTMLPWTRSSNVSLNCDSNSLGKYSDAKLSRNLIYFYFWDYNIFTAFLPSLFFLQMLTNSSPYSHSISYTLFSLIITECIYVFAYAYTVLDITC